MTLQIGNPQDPLNQPGIVRYEPDGIVKFAYCTPVVQYLGVNNEQTALFRFVPNVVLANPASTAEVVPGFFEATGAEINVGVGSGAMACFQEDLIRIKPPSSLKEKTKQYEEDNKRVVKVSDVCEIVDQTFQPDFIEALVQLFANQSTAAEMGLGESMPERIKARVREAALSQSSKRTRATKRYSPRATLSDRIKKTIPKSL